MQPIFMLIGQFFLAFVPATIVGQIVMIFQTVPAPWYEAPATISGILTLVGLIVGQIITRLWNSRDKKDDQHVSIATLTYNLSQQERKEVLGELHKVHDREIRFEKNKAQLSAIEAFESRIRAHRSQNEMQRLHHHIYETHTLMAKAGIAIPEFKLKSGDDLMKGLEEEVANFKRQLNDEIHESAG